MANKVKYNLRNVHYAVATIDNETGEATYSTPVKWPGAVSVAFNARNSEANFYADGIDYWSAFGNNGYEGTFESALIPESFRKSVLGEVENESDGVMIETTDVANTKFALLFEFEGDVNAVKHVLYNCSASRPSVEGETDTDSINVKTETINLTCASIYNSALDKNIVKARCSDTSSPAYTTWNTAVYQPA